MSADFWAGYVSGAAGIIIGNPLDLLKTRLQAGDTSIHTTSSESLRGTFDKAGTLVRGATAPILGYGALNGLLYYTYNRSLTLLGEPYTHPTSLAKIWTAGAVGGLASFLISCPTELIKCRAQVASSRSNTGSLAIAREIWSRSGGWKFLGGARGLYFGGSVTALRDSVGYGFYFWSYELSKRSLGVETPGESPRMTAMKILLAGGVAGVITWVSIFPLDVVKTRVQTQDFDPRFTLAGSGASSPGNSSPASVNEESSLLAQEQQKRYKRLGAVEIARQAYANEGMAVFFRGLGICTVRAFIVNAVQWAVYEWMMRVLTRSSSGFKGDAGAEAL